MGKSTVAQMLRRLGLPVHDADACVHRLFAQSGRAVEPISEAFPGVVVNGSIDRNKLSAKVFGKPDELNLLEAIVHPLVRNERNRFLSENRRRRSRLVVLNVPLLYETKGQGLCDKVIVVSAPTFLQRRRALVRPEMTTDKLALILARQMPDHKKRKLADVVIYTGLGFSDTRRRLARYIHRLQELPGAGR